MVGEISYSSARPVGGEELQRLFRQTSWASGRSIPDNERMLSRTPIQVGAWRDYRLVGFARSVTDDTYRALIDDVVVDQDLRGQGIGAGLVRHLLHRLQGVAEVLLSCSEDVAPFYQIFGFSLASNPCLKRVTSVPAPDRRSGCGEAPTPPVPPGIAPHLTKGSTFG